MGVSVFYLAAFEPDFYLHSFVAKDHDEEAGISEHVVWSIQIPGIFLAFLASVKYSRLLPKNAKVWLLMWALACIYFAGEEASWGQWYFHWDTPESFRHLNDQQETNLHNVSSWFDQKPRFVVESWIFLAGFVWPLLRKFGIVKEHAVDSWKYWLSVPNQCFSAAVLFTIVRFCDWSHNEILKNFGHSEWREVTIALFLTLYLSSFWFRLRALSQAPNP
jgi:hypothetical protein